MHTMNTAFRVVLVIELSSDVNILVSIHIDDAKRELNLKATNVRFNSKEQFIRTNRNTILV